MKTTNKKIKTNKYFLGGFTVPNFNGQQGAKLVNSGLDAVSSLIPSSGSGKTDAITNGIAGGLDAVGSAFGPLGSVIGKAAGLLTKGIGAMVGTPDQVNTDTGGYIKGKGIKGRRSRDKKIAQWNRVNQGISDAAATANLQQEYADEYGQNDYSLAAYGGVIPNTLAYLDDGELLRTPNGEINYIPEQGKPTDSNLLNVPVGTQVLSDKLKVPGTNKTFAEVGKKLMKTGKKKGNDIYAQNSQMLNERNNQQKYDELIQLQEQVKNKKDIKGRINKYDTGTTKRGIRNVQSASDLNWVNDMMSSPWFQSTMAMITPENINEYNKLQNTYPTLGFGDVKPGDVELNVNDAVRDYQGNFDNITDMNAAISDLYRKERLVGRGGSADKAETWRDGLAGDATWLRNLGRNVTPEQLYQINRMLHSSVEAYVNPENNMVNYRVRRSIPNTPERTWGTYLNRKDQDGNLIASNPVTDSPVLNRVPIKPPKIRRINDSELNGITSFSELNGITSFSSLIGPLANIYDSTPEQAPVRTYTPHFAPTEYNINPLLRDIDRNAAINRYNVNRAGGAGTGANLAQAVQSQVASDRAVAEVYAQKDNIERQRQAANAGIYNDWARYNAEAFHRGDVENAQNRAAARNLRRIGFSQLGTALQSMSRDKRLTNRDRAVLEFMKPYLEYGTPSEALSGLYNIYYN